MILWFIQSVSIIPIQKNRKTVLVREQTELSIGSIVFFIDSDWMEFLNAQIPTHTTTITNNQNNLNLMELDLVFSELFFDF